MHHKPQYIVKKAKSQFVCSGICHRFSAYKICEHIVAACEDSGNLELFCNWWKCLKSGPNLDSLALSGLPKGIAGNKGGVPTCSRRGRKSNNYQLSVHDRVTIVANAQTTSNTSSSLEPDQFLTQS